MRDAQSVCAVRAHPHGRHLPHGHARSVTGLALLRHTHTLCARPTPTTERGDDSVVWSLETHAHLPNTHRGKTRLKRIYSERVVQQTKTTLIKAHNIFSSSAEFSMRQSIIREETIFKNPCALKKTASDSDHLTTLSEHPRCSSQTFPLKQLS